MIDQEALKNVGKQLAKRGGSDPSERWIQVNKLDKPIDIRVMDPLPSMNGIYFIEVPVWWVDGKKVISPSITFKDPSKDDIIGQFINEAEQAAKKDKTLANLLNAKNDHKMPKIQLKYEYWLPVLKFTWEDREVPGIIKNGTVADYIEDGRVKILVANLTVLKQINTFLTDRVYQYALDPDRGANFQIQKTGEGRDTKYSVIVRDQMAMPKEFYTDKAITNPFEIAQALMMNDAYMEAVICKYLYNDCEIPEDRDNYYRFPEIREKLKDKLADQDEEPQQEVRQRPGRGQTPVEEKFERASRQEPQREPVRETPKTPENDLPWEDPENKTTEVKRPGRPAGRRRNLAADIQSVD